MLVEAGRTCAEPASKTCPGPASRTRWPEDRFSSVCVAVVRPQVVNRNKQSFVPLCACARRVRVRWRTQRLCRRAYSMLSSVGRTQECTSCAEHVPARGANIAPTGMHGTSASRGQCLQARREHVRITGSERTERGVSRHGQQRLLAFDAFGGATVGGQARALRARARACAARRGRHAHDAVEADGPLLTRSLHPSRVVSLGNSFLFSLGGIQTQKCGVEGRGTKTRTCCLSSRSSLYDSRTHKSTR